MKHRKLFTVVLAAAGVLVLGSSSRAKAEGNGAGIVGSPHDFSSATWNHKKEVCRVCHIPHEHERETGRVGLLWNHRLSENVYVLYTSSTLDGAIEQPTGISKKCLGCHDDSVGIDQFDSKVNLPGTVFMRDFDGGGFNVPQLDGGTNLTATHPISIEYLETEPDHAPKTALMGTSGTIDDVLEYGKVQCSSCHDVHDSAGEAVPDTHLLRVPQSIAQGGNPSGLCLTCHQK